MTYQFRKGSRVTGIDAETAGTELDRINREQGSLTAPAVVDAARPADAPLHPAFEWDDQLAAELHRQHQARDLIRSVTIIHEEERIQAFTHVTPIGYLPTPIVASNPDLYQIAERESVERLAKASESLDKLRRAAGVDQQVRVARAQRLLSSATQALRT